MRIGKATKKCHICGRPYTSLCDATNKDGEPCDLPMCDTHRNRVGLDVDVCDVHDNHIDREQAKRNRHERGKAKLHFRERYFNEIEIRMLGDLLYEPATIKDADKWIEERKQEETLIKSANKRKLENEIVARIESKKAIRKSITALRIMSENCNKYEDCLAYKDRYTSLILGMDALKKQIELMEWIEELGKENEYDMRMIKEVVDILREVSIL